MVVSIVGLPGVGKTTFGQQLADALGLQFIDLDYVIEEETGNTIPELFESQGEAGFRQLEHEALKKVLSQTNAVLATGGGAASFGQNMSIMLDSSIVVYLQDDLNAIAKRLLQDKSQRPLFSSLNEVALSTKLKSIYEKRIADYRQSHIITGIEASTKIQLFTNRLDLFTK